MMFARFRLRALLPLAAIGLAAGLLGGCVYDPYGYYGYGYGYPAYSYPAYGYYGAVPAVSFNYGYWSHPGWDHGYWHDWEH